MGWFLAVPLVPYLCIEMLHLKKEVYAYHYLSQSGCSYVLTMDDDQQFGVTVVSLQLCLQVGCPEAKVDRWGHSRMYLT